MARDNGQGIFQMDVINRIAGISDLATAKQAVQQTIDDSSARAENKQKASAMVQKAVSIKQLLLGMSNFMLSHSGMKTIR